MLLTSYGIFLLSEGGYPRDKNWEKGQRLIAEAIQMDPKLKKFEVAKGSFFHWSVVANNKNPLAWLNWALIQQCVEGEMNKAEKYYRQAGTILFYPEINGSSELRNTWYCSRPSKKKGINVRKIS